MKKILAIGMALVMVAMTAVPMINADDAETITINISPGPGVDINITDSSTAGGNVITTWNPSCVVGETGNTETLDAFIWNDGLVNVTVDVTATDTTDWTLVDGQVSGTLHDKFSLKIAQDDSNPGDWDTTSHFDASGYYGAESDIYPYIYTVEDAAAFNPDPSKQILNNDLETSAAGTYGYIGIDITLTMPTSSSTNDQQTTTITFTATAN
jgi:hypothetical protein